MKEGIELKLKANISEVRRSPTEQDRLLIFSVNAGESREKKFLVIMFAQEQQ